MAVGVALGVDVGLGVGVAPGPPVTNISPGPINSGNGLGAPLVGLPYKPGACGMPPTIRAATVSGVPAKLRLSARAAIENQRDGVSKVIIVCSTL